MKSAKNSQLTKGQRTSDRILLAAADCIASIGIERTSITAIAARAKVSRGLVAHYFPVKSRLFKQVMLKIAQEAYTTIEQPPQELSPQEKIVHMFRSNVEFFIENRNFFTCLMLFYYYAGLKSDFKALNTQFNARATSRLIEYLNEIEVRGAKAKSQINSRMMAESIHRELVGAIQKYFIDHHHLDSQAYVDLCLKAIRHRLSKL
jgi:AcrR family transcriptional regulator